MYHPRFRISWHGRYCMMSRVRVQTTWTCDLSRVMRSGSINRGVVACSELNPSGAYCIVIQIDSAEFFQRVHETALQCSLTMAFPLGRIPRALHILHAFYHRLNRSSIIPVCTAVLNVHLKRRLRVSASCVFTDCSGCAVRGQPSFAFRSINILGEHPNLTRCRVSTDK